MDPVLSIYLSVEQILPPSPVKIPRMFEVSSITTVNVAIVRDPKIISKLFSPRPSPPGMIKLAIVESATETGTLIISPLADIKRAS